MGKVEDYIIIVRRIKKENKIQEIGEVLELEDIFTEGELSKLSLKNIIEEGDIGWLASSCLTEKEATLICMHQREIEKELHNPSLRVLADNKQIPIISKVLESYGIKNLKK